MTTLHFTNLPDRSGVHILPEGLWMGLILFGALWLLPVLAMILLASN